MPAEVILYGPESQAYSTSIAVVPAPGDNGSGGQIAQRGKLPLGQQLVLQDGRKFRFTLAGAVTLVLGMVQQSAAIITTDQSMAAAAAVVGDRTITFTHGGATAPINKFAEGYAVVSLDPGQGNAYKIASHLALTSGGSDVVNLAPGISVQVALTTTSDISLLAQPYSGVVLCAATITGVPIGVCIVPITNAEFGWLQTRGPAAVNCTGTILIGGPVVMLLSGGTAGTPAPATAATQPEVGKVLMPEATGEASGLFLTIDG